MPAAPFKFTAERIVIAKKIAADGGTAREAAEAVGLDPEREYLIYKLARREGFQFSNVGRKRDDRAVFIRLDDQTSQVLTQLARQHSRPRRDLAARLVTIVLQQGQPFIDNLLDDEA